MIKLTKLWINPENVGLLAKAWSLISRGQEFLLWLDLEVPLTPIVTFQFLYPFDSDKISFCPIHPKPLVPSDVQFLDFSYSVHLQSSS